MSTVMLVVLIVLAGVSVFQAFMLLQIEAKIDFTNEMLVKVWKTAHPEADSSTNLRDGRI
jgi:hypothetical protein